MAGNSIHLGDALDTVAAYLREKFPDVMVVVAEDHPSTVTVVPLLLLNFIDLEPDPDADASTGQWPCQVRLEASIVFGHKNPKNHRALIQFGAAVAHAVHNARMGVRWGGGSVGACEPDEFSPQASQFECWRVEWQHRADLGDAIEVDTFVPKTVVFSHSPDIGPASEVSYSPIGDQS